MRIKMKLAQHGMGMQEGTIVQWHKQEGESFAIGDLLLEVETAKSNVEIEAEAAGTVIQILAQVGEEVPVGGLLAELDIQS